MQEPPLSTIEGGGSFLFSKLIEFDGFALNYVIFALNYVNGLCTPHTTSLWFSIVFAWLMFGGVMSDNRVVESCVYTVYMHGISVSYTLHNDVLERGGVSLLPNVAERYF